MEVPGYTSPDPQYSPTALKGAIGELTTSQVEDDRVAGAYKAAHDRRIEAEAKFHDLAVRAKAHVRTLFGRDAAKLHEVGLKRKSDRKPQRRKQAAAATETGAAPHGATPPATPAPTPPATAPSTVIKPAA